jgi:hypothetical protein
MLSKQEDTMNEDRKALTLQYLQAVGSRDYARLQELLVADLRFRGPANSRSSATDFIGALKRLSAIHVRNDVKRVFVDGDEVCVIYDFVTDTSAGALSTIEWLHFEGSRVRSIDLYYDQLPWQAALKTMAERTAQPAA